MTPSGRPLWEPGRVSPWGDVEREIQSLADSGEPLFTVTGERNTIVGYIPNDHLIVDTKKGRDQVSIDDIRTHWATLIERRRVSLDDILHPGHRSAFMAALFRRIPGVDVEKDGRRHYLVVS
jgi:hypothetical protein